MRPHRLLTESKARAALAQPRVRVHGNLIYTYTPASAGMRASTKAFAGELYDSAAVSGAPHKFARRLFFLLCVYIGTHCTAVRSLAERWRVVNHARPR